MDRTRPLLTYLVLGCAATLSTWAAFVLPRHPVTPSTYVRPLIPDPPRTPTPPPQSRPQVDVVFVLDTTGSMSSLLDGAKKKIWEIARFIAQGQPAPELRIGLPLRRGVEIYAGLEVPTFFSLKRQRWRWAFGNAQILKLNWRGLLFGRELTLLQKAGFLIHLTAWFNFNPRFYIIALIYIVFDVEIAFIYPVATVFKRWVEQGSGLFALLEIFVFVAILMLGLVYVWAKGDLEWIRSIKGDPDRKSVV